MHAFANTNKEMGLKLANNININTLSSKIKKEKVGAIRLCMRGINEADENLAREIINRLNPKLREKLQKRGWLKWCYS